MRVRGEMSSAAITLVLLAMRDLRRVHAGSCAADRGPPDSWEVTTVCACKPSSHPGEQCSALAVERPHRALVENLAIFLPSSELTSTDSDRLHAAPDPRVVAVRARLRDAGVRSAPWPAVVSVNVCASSKWRNRTAAAAPLRLGCPAGYRWRVAGGRGPSGARARDCSGPGRGRDARSAGGRVLDRSGLGAQQAVPRCIPGGRRHDAFR